MAKYQSPQYVLSLVVPWSRIPLPRGAAPAALRVFSQFFSHGDDAYSVLRDRAVNVSVTWDNTAVDVVHTLGALRFTFYIYAPITTTEEQRAAFTTAMLLELEGRT